LAEFEETFDICDAVFFLSDVIAKCFFSFLKQTLVDDEEEVVCADVVVDVDVDVDVDEDVDVEVDIDIEVDVDVDVEVATVDVNNDDDG
jgi:hypothetical protein